MRHPFLAAAAVSLLAVSCAFAQDRVIPAGADVSSVVFSRDGSTLAGLCRDGRLRQWDVRSGALRRTVGWSDGESPAGLAAAGGIFAATGADGSIVLRRWEDWTELRRIAGPAQRHVRAAAVSSDYQLVAGSSRVDGNGREELMRLWDGTGRQRFAVPGGAGGTSALAISPDGSVLAAGSWDTNLRIWSTRNGELLRMIETLPVAMFALAFTPDGRYLATAGVDRTVYLWDTKTWRLERKLSGQPEMISALAFSADGRWFATGGFNDIAERHPVSILLWDTESGKVVRTLAAPHRVSSVAFSPDGSLLAATAGDDKVRLWVLQ